MKRQIHCEGDLRHIRFEPDMSNPTEIYIMDAEDKDAAVKVIRINSDGYAASRTGFAGPYTALSQLPGKKEPAADK
jgi:hypothetical protein